MPEVPDLSKYVSVMSRLRDKGMTLRAIAEFLTAQLGVRVTHTAVFRLLKDTTKIPGEEYTFEDFTADQLMKRDELQREIEEDSR